MKKFDNRAMADALRIANQRIEQLCSTVNTLAGFRKVRSEDFIVKAGPL